MSDSSVSPKSVLEKFEFYFLGLTFTLLGASIQTSSFNSYPCFSIYLELTAWGLFIISGLVGLSKVEWVSPILFANNRKSSLEEVARQLRLFESRGLSSAFLADTGEDRPINEILPTIEASIAKWDTKVSELGKTHGWKHNIQKISFAAGLITIAIARGYAALHPIIEKNG